MTKKRVTIIGGGLAGAEAAFQVAERDKGVEVILHEMKPERFSAAHKLSSLAELVCSNSLKSTALENSSGLLKEEMRLMDSLIVRAAEQTCVPAGGALAVDRDKFSGFVTESLLDIGVTILRGEVTAIPKQRPLIIATGPLTSELFARELEGLLGAGSLYFYDAVAPIIYADSIDMKKAFLGSRYGRSGDDYINCPMDRDCYDDFVGELTSADVTGMREFEEQRYFEGCLPIEVMAGRGPMTLAFGPLKPVGLQDNSSKGALEADSDRAYAVVQLRRENRDGTLYNMVGFQTRLTYGEQKRVFRKIPGLEGARFARLGKIHRNSFIDSPRLLGPGCELVKEPGLFFAGQITGVEGYLESAVSGLMAGLNALRNLDGKDVITPPATTMTGALILHPRQTAIEPFQPMNANFGLLPRAQVKLRKKERRAFYARRAIEDLKGFMERFDLLPARY